MTELSAETQTKLMRQCLDLAEKSPPKPTNFRVGALIVHLQSGNVVSTGYTLELEGNTHAEECCLLKLSEQHGCKPADLSMKMKTPHVLFTTVEPCCKRLSGKMPCVDRILEQHEWISQVLVGMLEPETFVEGNNGRHKLSEAGLEVHAVEGLEDEIHQVATAGHT